MILPITLLWTLVFILIWPTNWGLVDVTTYFVDPLTFGSYTLLFSILVILGLSANWNKLSWIQRCLCILGIMSGFYLSHKSGSRTGWFNLPIFCLIWSYFVLMPMYGFKKTFLIVVIFLCFILGVFLTNDYFLKKFSLIWVEILDYQWGDSNPDTSVRLRLSIYRMGIVYFLERPITGWGDLSWMAQMNRLDFVPFASEYARKSPRHGFHNELITNAVRSGVWGLLASLSLFGMVFLRAIQGLRLKSSGDHRLVSLTLLVFISHLFIAGLTTEITNLVFLSSFIGLTLAVLLGEQIYLEENSKYDLN